MTYIVPKSLSTGELYGLKYPVVSIQYSGIFQ